MQLKESDCRKVFGPCHTDFGLLVGDVYRIWIDLDTLKRCEPRQGSLMYVKVAIDVNEEEGDACALVSFHESRM